MSAHCPLTYSDFSRLLRPPKVQCGKACQRAVDSSRACSESGNLGFLFSVSLHSSCLNIVHLSILTPLPHQRLHLCLLLRSSPPSAVLRLTNHAPLLAVENGEASNRRFRFSHLWPVYLDALSGAPESQTPRDHPFGEAVSLHSLRFLWLSHAWNLWTCAPPSERVVSRRTWAG